VTRIRTLDGKLLYMRQPEAPNQVIEPRSVAAMNVMMEETLISGTARKAEIPGWQAAGKTGTSQDFRDAWFIGYTSKLVAGIWLGNDDNTPSKHAVGGGLPVEIWSRFMRTALAGHAPAALPGVGEPGWFGAPFGAPSAAPTSPAEVGNQPANRNDSGGLDFWLLDKLFGRR
jgi:penicillin-binding protein 1A